jgi:ketosteroid isomerase-like protein
MSQENVEVVLNSYARFNAGERDPVQLQIWHEDGEWHAASEDPDSTIHRGIDAIRRHYARWVEAYPDLRVEPVEAKANGDHVFVWVHVSGHGGASGVPMDSEMAHLHTMREGKLTRLVVYTDKAEALEAAGLSEQDAHAER